MTLYLLGKTKAGQRRFGQEYTPPYRIVGLYPTPNTSLPVTSFSCADTEEAQRALLDHIEQWCRYANITIGNREEWLLGEQSP